jgi:hypothetical protein
VRSSGVDLLTRRTRPERCSAVHFASGCGRCPPDNHLGNAESRELHKTD